VQIADDQAHGTSPGDLSNRPTRWGIMGRGNEAIAPQFGSISSDERSICVGRQVGPDCAVGSRRETKRWNIENGLDALPNWLLWSAI
jgi:hypothetical protein